MRCILTRPLSISVCTPQNIRPIENVDSCEKLIWRVIPVDHDAVKHSIVKDCQDNPLKLSLISYGPARILLTNVTLRVTINNDSFFCSQGA